jgi:type VI secretion system protein ImpH
MSLGRDERSRLQRDGQSAVGRGAVLGKSVWDVQHKFRIVMGPLNWERFAAMLPDGRALAQLRALVRQYMGFEFAWDLRLILKRDEVPSWSLAGTRDRRVGRLGRTAWLQGGKIYRRAADADQLIMNVESIRLGADRMNAPAA